MNGTINKRKICDFYIVCRNLHVCYFEMNFISVYFSLYYMKPPRRFFRTLCNLNCLLFGEKVKCHTQSFTEIPCAWVYAGWNQKFSFHLSLTTNFRIDPIDKISQVYTMNYKKMRNTCSLSHYRVKWINT